MNVVPASIPDCLSLQPRVFPDERGFFFESYNERELAKLGVNYKFVQDNHSRSAKNVLRGLHYQIGQAQGKLVRVASGEIFDVAVDLRRSSPYFGKWTGLRLSSENKTMFWIPPGFAHGFVALSDTADLLYKATDFYAAEYERTIQWNDPDLKIEWPIDVPPIVSDKDRAGMLFREAETFA
jgi:dTDP-4-dehydrorhamnose 3,5-epimerase